MRARCSAELLQVQGHAVRCPGVHWAACSLPLLHAVSSLVNVQVIGRLKAYRFSGQMQPLQLQGDAVRCPGVHWAARSLAVLRLHGNLQGLSRTNTRSLAVLGFEAVPRGIRAG